MFGDPKIVSADRTKLLQLDAVARDLRNTPSLLKRTPGDNAAGFLPFPTDSTVAPLAKHDRPVASVEVARAAALCIFGLFMGQRTWRVAAP